MASKTSDHELFHHTPRKPTKGTAFQAHDDLAKAKVAGSRPVSRSRQIRGLRHSP
jgi:hypothetical protein